jgi:hypothetical protein
MEMSSGEPNRDEAATQPDVTLQQPAFGAPWGSPSDDLATAPFADPFQPTVQPQIPQAQIPQPQARFQPEPTLVDPYNWYAPSQYQDAPGTIPYPAPPAPGRTHKLRNGLLAVGVVAVVGAAAFTVVDLQHQDKTTANASPTKDSTTAKPSAGASLNPDELNSAGTDPTPFTSTALLPQNFQDTKGIEYELKGSSTEGCDNNLMSGNVAAALQQNGCTEELAGTYTVDSPTVDSSDDVLVSVQIFAFKDAATAKAFDAAFPAGASGTWDFGVWCPASGDGANPCSASADYPDAAKSEVLSQSYRYVVEATALYSEMTTDTTYAAWTEAAAEQATQMAGPANYLATTDQI